MKILLVICSVLSLSVGVPSVRRTRGLFEEGDNKYVPGDSKIVADVLGPFFEWREGMPAKEVIYNLGTENYETAPGLGTVVKTGTGAAGAAGGLAGGLGGHAGGLGGAAGGLGGAAGGLGGGLGGKSYYAYSRPYYRKGPSGVRRLVGGGGFSNGGAGGAGGGTGGAGGAQGTFAKTFSSHDKGPDYNVTTSLGIHHPEGPPHLLAVIT